MRLALLSNEAAYLKRLLWHGFVRVGSHEPRSCSYHRLTGGHVFELLRFDEMHLLEAGVAM